ncbi:MAG: HU family DNA-binding protein [Anaeroplasmataceae bacterium]|nr:HU family DNA-binding protein [Anaeroplasmataceae bacterium]MDE5868403.1 HU family DNA-binding protein [Anaeroplasmataceae bacterium]
MNKSELISVVADKVDTTKKEAEGMVNAVFEAIIEALKDNDKVVLTGFGTFEVHERAARTGRNPQTGEDILIEGGKAPVFKAAKALKDEING